VKLLTVVSILLMFQLPGRSQGRSHARSMVITQSGIVATSQTLASQAGAQILARGGSAVDAAIAANAVLSVTEPMMCGLGGDLFVMYWDAKAKKLTGLNASGWAPRNLTIEALAAKGHGLMPSSGIHSVTVPGAVDGWDKMHKRYGKLPWKDLFQPAMYYASNGFPVTETIQQHWQDSTYQRVLLDSENAKKTFLPNGSAPRLGEVFRNPDLAHAFELLARGGRQAFYGGSIGEAILSTSKKLGGTMELADFTEFSSEWVTPISTKYRHWTVYELPPNGQGIAALQMLNILEQTPAAGDPLSAAAIHTRIEAMKLAYADLSHVADQRMAHVPVQGMIDKFYAKERADLIDPNRAQCNVTAGEPPRDSKNTVYLAVVDKEGNIASWIQSISNLWGSGIVVDGMGFALQNRGGNFDLDALLPNALAPHKRPRHTIIPAFMEHEYQRIAFGIMGGANQPMAHAQFVSNFVDYGLNLQAAMEAPRFTKAFIGGCDVLVEGRLTPEVLEALRGKGHIITELKEYATAVGRGQAILHEDKTGVNFGASSPQGDGAAIPQPDAYFNRPNPTRRKATFKATSPDRRQ
jgi:gamma-glutamyltranspeptidase/glutathione hydrolase